MNIEEALKDVYERRAELTPSANRVRDAVAARVPVRARPSGRRIALLAAGVAALVAAPIVVVVSVSDTARNTTQINPATESAQPTPPAATGPVMKYAPSWLPDGLVETERSHNPKLDGMARKWTRPGDRASVLISAGHKKELSRPTNSQPVEVNGHPGVIIDIASDKYSVEWLPAPNESVSVYVELGADPAATVLRVARSVRSDTSVAIAPAVGFGWLPDGVKADICKSGGEPDGAVYTEARAADSPLTSQVAVQIVPQRPEIDENSESVTVLGRPGVYQRRGEIVVQLDGRYWLRVNAMTRGSTQQSKEFLTKVADSLKIGDLNFGWFGKRGLPN